jgi:hypothetical protein
LAFTLDDRERIHCRVRETVPATDRTDRCFDEIADDFEFPGAAAGQPTGARELAFECGGLRRPARRQV